MAQWVKVLAAKCYLISLILETHMAEGENSLYKLSSTLYMYSWHMRPTTHIVQKMYPSKKESLNLPFSLLQDFVFFFISPKFQG